MAMSTCLWAWMFAGLSFATVALIPAAAAAPLSPPHAVPSDAECEVWARELGFAQSVADHDADAFAGFVHPQAAFGVKGPRPIRGRDAIVQAWAALISGKPVQLSWYPTIVVIAGDPGIASSSGPALYRSRDAQGEPQVLIGAFQSIWTHGEDGVWRVLFDDGIRPVPASTEDIAAFEAGRERGCRHPAEAG
jgi:ketosteroid isomerase-like protein